MAEQEGNSALKNWNKEENKIERKHKRAGGKRAGLQERLLPALFHHNPGRLLITWLFYKQDWLFCQRVKDNSRICPFLMFKGTPPPHSFRDTQPRMACQEGHTSPQTPSTLKKTLPRRPCFLSQREVGRIRHHGITQNKILSEVQVWWSHWAGLENRVGGHKKKPVNKCSSLKRTEFGGKVRPEVLFHLLSSQFGNHILFLNGMGYSLLRQSYN